MIKSTGALARFRPFLLASVAGIGLVTGGVAQAQVARRPDHPQPAGEQRFQGRWRRCAFGSAHHRRARSGSSNPNPIFRSPIRAPRPRRATRSTSPASGRSSSTPAMAADRSACAPHRSSTRARCCSRRTASIRRRRPLTGAPDRPATGTAVSIGFSNNNLSALQQWIFAGANQYQSNPAAFLYNLNQVVYNARSTEPGNGFLYADIALGTLDTARCRHPDLGAALLGAPGTGLDRGERHRLSCQHHRLWQ